MARFTNGWVKVCRGVADEDIGKRGNFTLGIFLRILLRANWREGSAPLGGQGIKLLPGQLATGLRDLSPDEEEDPHLHRVRSALRYLEKRGTIAQATCNHGRVITICNWLDYQIQEDDQSKQPANDAQTVRKHPANDAQHIEEVKKGRKKKEGGKGAVALPPLAEIWNQKRGQLPGVRGCSKSRAAKASERWSENSDPGYWGEVIDRIVRSRFCSGQNNRGWKADFDFLIQPDTHHKVLEGKYDDRKTAPGLTGSFLDDPEIRAEVEGYERARREAMGNL